MQAPMSERADSGGGQEWLAHMPQSPPSRFVSHTSEGAKLREGSARGVMMVSALAGTLLAASIAVL